MTLRDFITDLYQHYLGRDPEAGAVEGWATAAKHMKSVSSLVNAILDSEEFKQGHADLIAEIQGTVPSPPAPVSTPPPAPTSVPPSPPPPQVPPSPPSPPPGPIVASGTSEVWFGPLQVGDDFDSLFTNPDLWQETRKRLTGMLFYDLHLTDPRFMDHLVMLDAFKKLRDLGLSIGLETAAIKHWECSGASMAARVTIPVIDSIAAHGGQVTHVAPEEPYYDGSFRLDDKGQKQNCGLSMEQAADQTRLYYAAIRAKYPAIIFGDVEPYPVLYMDQILAWLARLKQGDPAPTFFHLDVDLAAVKARSTNIRSDLGRLRSACGTLGMQLGIIVTANLWTAMDDAGFFSGSMDWLRIVKAAIGSPPRLVFESWLETPVLPKRNLPEHAPNTFTALIGAGLALLGNPGPPPTSSPIPPPPPPTPPSSTPSPTPTPPPTPIPPAPDPSLLASGWDFNLTKKIARTTGNPGDPNYYGVGVDDKHWLFVLESEEKPNISCPGPVNRSFLINGPESPATLLWSPHTDAAGDNWTVNMKIDHYTRPSPCGPGFFTFFSMMDHADLGGGPLPDPLNLVVEHQIVYDQWVPPSGDHEVRLLVGAQGYWNGKARILEVNLAQVGWADADPDPGVIIRTTDWYANGSAAYVVLAGSQFGLSVPLGQTKIVRIDWAALFSQAITRGWFDKPIGGRATQAVYIGIEVKNQGVANLWHTNFRIYNRL